MSRGKEAFRPVIQHPVHIVLLCATRRGYLFLRKLTELLPHCQLAVFSFPEEPWEPRFLEDIRNLTLTHSGTFFETRDAGGREVEGFWDSVPVDLVLVASWRFMIPPSVYNRPRYGTYVFHDSLLPEYRGFSPTVWAIINGEDNTGVSLFRIDAQPDAGDIVDQKRVPIGPDDTIADVMERVTDVYLELLERNLHKLISGTAECRPPDPSRATYACKRVLEDNAIDWSATSDSIYNLVRAVTAPYSGAYTYLSGRKMSVWAAQRLPRARRYAGRIPGRIVEVLPELGSVILTGDGALLLTQVQLEGQPIVCAAEVLNSLSQTLGR